MGQYQSRLFNYVIQQSHRIAETATIAFRRLRVATTWSVEAIAFSLDAIFKNGRSSGKSFPDSTTADAQFVPPATDAPILHILDLVEALPTEAIPRSIASSIASRQPILVGADNTIIYELSPAQQDILNKSIVNSLPDRDRRELSQFRSPQPQFSSQLLQQARRTFSLVRQTTRHASILPESSPFVQSATQILNGVKDRATSMIPDRSLPNIDRAFVRIDRACANLEAAYLPKLKTARSQAYKRLDSLKNFAIDYFSHSLKPPQFHAEIEDPWLGTNDRPSSSPEPSRLPPSQFQVPLQTWVDRLSRKLRGFTPSPLVKKKTEIGVMSPVSKSPVIASKIQSSPLRSDDRERDWIETQGRSQGYVKHPLERILEWIDRWMLRLEQWFENIWNGGSNK